jgi:mannose-6-phosphate isomerase-like protein (cupin superfamily)
VKTVVLGPGEGDSLSVAGNTVAFKAEHAETDGRFGLVEYTAAPGSPGPPLHLHREMVEMFFVLDGELSLRVGEETVPAPKGSFVLVPPETPHTFASPGGDPARFLILMLPGGFEQYFRELRDALGAGPPDPTAMADLLSKYDIAVVEG